VDSAYLGALAALAGSVIGGTTSLGTSWLTQRVQAREQLRAQDKSRRQELYKEFIEEASALYGDALSHTVKDPSKLVGVYAKVGRIRILASEPVLQSAEKVMHVIIETYLGPNLTLEELEKMPHSAIDLLKEFSDACRKELRSLNYL
jgi:hypothetical protein